MAILIVKREHARGANAVLVVILRRTERWEKAFAHVREAWTAIESMMLVGNLDQLIEGYDCHVGPATGGQVHIQYSFQMTDLLPLRRLQKMSFKVFETRNEEPGTVLRSRGNG